MIYGALASIVVAFHFVFIVFAALGGLIALRVRWIPWLHLPAAGWAAIVVLFGWICPLTPLENALRRAAGAEGYAGGFIDRYLVPVIYPAGLTREIQIGLGLALLALNLAVYAVVLRRRRRGARPDPPRSPASARTGPGATS